MNNIDGKIIEDRGRKGFGGDMLCRGIFPPFARSGKEILHPFLSWSLDSTYMTKDVQKAMLYFTFLYYKAKAFVVWLKIILLSFCKNFMTMVYAYTCVIIHRDALRHQTGVCAHAHMENSLKSRKNCLDEEN